MHMAWHGLCVHSTKKIHTSRAQALRRTGSWTPRHSGGLRQAWRAAKNAEHTLIISVSPCNEPIVQKGALNTLDDLTAHTSSRLK